MLEVQVGKGRKRKTLTFPNLNRHQLSTMTELTQSQMFGEVVRKRPSSQSIHPFGRRRVPRAAWDKMSKPARLKHLYGVG